MGHLLFSILFFVLLFTLFFCGELAFAFSNKLRFELGDGGKINGWLVSFFYRHAVDFISSLFLAALICFAGIVFWAFRLCACADSLAWAVCCGIGVVVFFFGSLGLSLWGMSRFSATSIFMVLAYPFFLVYWLLMPLTKGLKALLTCFGAVRMNPNWAFSINRIRLPEDSAEAKDEEEDFGDEVKMFQNALDFSTVKIKDSMVPRTEIMAVDINTSLDDLRKLFVESHFSRILVFRDTIDNVLGYVHSADMFDNPTSVEQMLNPIIVVPETLTANIVLRQFLKQKKSIALVVDEFGGTSGLLTIEDVMEEIFGEIEDEHDNDEDDELVCKKIADNEYVISARLEVEQVNDELDLSLPMSEDYLTIGGLLLSRNAFLPAVGDVVPVSDRYSFKVVRRSPSRIDVVRLFLNEPAKTPAATA